MKTYSDLRLSEYEWLGSVPVHWKWVYLFQTCSEKCNKNVGNAETNVLSLSYGRIIRKKDINFGLVPKDYASYQIVEPNDIIMRLTDLQNDHRSLRTGLVHERGIITSAYVCLTPFGNAEYLQQLLHAYDIQKYFYGLGGGVRQSIGYNDIRYTKLPLPSNEEQEQIVRWLDWQTSRIGKFIRAKRREIECLKELKKAVVSKAVTQGINSNAEMRDSGVKWLGKTPTHWDVSTIKKHFRIVKEIAGTEGYDVLSITQQGLKVKNLESNEGQMAQNYSGYQFVRPGDFAMNHMDLITGYVDYSSLFGVTSPDYRVFRLIDETSDYSQYFLRLFQNCYHRRIFYAFGRGAAEKGRWRLPRVNFESFEIPVPPREEQEAIASYLDEKCTAIDRLIAKLTDEINLVFEYRTRIISDAVTGKIDLRDADVPDYEDEADIMPTDEESDDTEEGETDADND